MIISLRTQARSVLHSFIISTSQRSDDGAVLLVLLTDFRDQRETVLNRIV